jgi:hypothetical protein
MPSKQERGSPARIRTSRERTKLRARYRYHLDRITEFADGLKTINVNQLPLDDVGAFGREDMALSLIFLACELLTPDDCGQLCYCFAERIYDRVCDSAREEVMEMAEIEREEAS